MQQPLEVSLHDSAAQTAAKEIDIQAGDGFNYDSAVRTRPASAQLQGGTNRLEKDENIPAHEKRRLQVYADDEDVVVRALGIPEAHYECVTVNGSWAEKSLLEGDVVLCADDRVPLAGDIVLIEQDGRVRLGMLAEPGVLETKHGSRPIGPSERIVGVGIALARKLSGGTIDFSL